MSADTGVGPAIASPSQLCSGNCADLPQAPSSNIRPIAVSAPLFAPAIPASTPAKLTEPKVTNMSMIALVQPRRAVMDDQQPRDNDRSHSVTRDPLIAG